MRVARNCTVTTVSVKPCLWSNRRTCSMMGLLTTGNSGLGWFAVMGRRRVPSPPAITTAFIGGASCAPSGASSGRSGMLIASTSVQLCRRSPRREDGLRNAHRCARWDMFSCGDDTPFRSDRTRGEPGRRFVVRSGTWPLPENPPVHLHPPNRGAAAGCPSALPFGSRRSVPRGELGVAVSDLHRRSRVISAFVTAGLGDQTQSLYGVEQSGPPVKSRSPQSEGPTHNSGHISHECVVSAQEQQGKCVEQAQRGSLAREVDR